MIIKRYKVKIELWNDEIEKIIEELGRVEHNVFEFMNYEILIDKLKTALERNIISTKKDICEGCGHHITSHYGGNDMSCKHINCFESKSCPRFLSSTKRGCGKPFHYSKGIEGQEGYEYKQSDSCGNNDQNILCPECEKSTDSALNSQETNFVAHLNKIDKSSPDTHSHIKNEIDKDYPKEICECGNLMAKGSALCRNCWKKRGTPTQQQYYDAKTNSEDKQ